MLNAYQQTKNSDISSIKNSRFLAGLNTVGEIERVDAIIILHDNADIPTEAFETFGVKTECIVGNALTASLPIENFDKVAKLDEVKMISLPKPVNLYNDAARLKSKVNEVHAGISLPQSYKGEGVILGIVDSGIDFNHINFKDENGNSRIKLAGCYNPSEDAYKLYYAPENIALLETDLKDASHGTHVTGIAGGSYTKNKFHGMAPASDLALFGLENQLYDNHLINGIYWIFNHADSENKPAVVNISIGSTMGPHDGTSYFNQMVDQMCGDGKVVVMAVGNNGDEKVHLNKTFTNASATNPQLSTIINCSGAAYTSMVDTWSNDGTHIGIQFFIYDRMNSKEVYSSKIFNPTVEEFENDEDSYIEYIWNQNDTKLTTYFNGTIGCGAETNIYNNKYNVFCLINGSTTSNNYRVGIKFYGEQGTEMNSWAYPTPTEFSNQSNINYLAGTTNNSFSDMICGKNVISVGSYNSKIEFSGIGDDGVEGSNVTNFGYRVTLDDISYFSSYGTDLTGRVHPDICAPGLSLVSSVNGYDTATTVTNKSVLIDEVSIEGDTRKYHWGDMPGTSMASPVVAGVVALMLQANPNLNATEIREILQSTAVSDEYTTNNSSQSGAGKLDAKAALVKAIQSSAIQTKNNSLSVADDVIMLYPNPSDGKFTVFAQNAKSEITVGIYNLNGAMVYNETTKPDNGIVNINASGTLVPGIYLVKVEGENINYSSRLIVK